MRECLITFTKTRKQITEPSKTLGGKPETRYLHTCKPQKISLIVTPETEASRLKLITAINNTCKRHCKAYKKCKSNQN